MLMYTSGPDPKLATVLALTLPITSGTTSRPKGVLSSHRSIMSAINMIGLLNYDPGPGPNLKPHLSPNSNRTPDTPDTLCRPIVQLVPVPLFHVNGTHNMLLSGAFLGKKLILMPKWDVARALELIAQEPNPTPHVGLNAELV